MFGPLRSGLLRNVTSVALTKITVPQATVGVQREVASLWQLALKHIYLGTVANAGTLRHTQTQADTHTRAHAQTLAARDLHSVNKGRVRVQTSVVSV